MRKAASIASVMRWLLNVAQAFEPVILSASLAGKPVSLFRISQAVNATRSGDCYLRVVLLADVLPAVFFAAGFRAGFFVPVVGFAGVGFRPVTFFVVRDLRGVRVLRAAGPLLPTSFLILWPATASPCWMTSTPWWAASFTTSTGLRSALVFDDMGRMVPERPVDAR
jgi:hypothetical protein